MPEVAMTTQTWPSSKAFAYDLLAACMRQGLTLPAAVLLTSHFALSTGWGRAVHNWNFAGRKASESEPYFRARGFEDNQTTGERTYSNFRWRAYASIDEGVAGILSTMRARRYAKAYQALLLGSDAYFLEIRLAGWYTAMPIESGPNQMRARARQIQTWLKEKLPTVIGVLVALGAVALWGLQ